MPKRFASLLGNYYRPLTDLLHAVNRHRSFDTITENIRVAHRQLLDMLREFLGVDHLTDETLSLLKADSLKELLALDDGENRPS